MRITFGPDRGDRVALGQAYGLANGSIQGGFNRCDASARADRDLHTRAAQSHPERVECEISVEPGGDLPANDRARMHIKRERDAHPLRDGSPSTKHDTIQSVSVTKFRPPVQGLRGRVPSSERTAPAHPP